MLACVVLILLLSVVAVLAHRALAQREAHERMMRARWREANVRALMAMSEAGRLPAYEQAQFDGAGDDPERMRQVLIRIHEERLADASKDLEDAQQRKMQLETDGGYKVYADQVQPRDLVQLANEDEWAATSAVGQYAEALRRLRAWQPESYAAFAAREGTATAAPVEASVAATPAAPKPDPRVPVPAEPERAQAGVDEPSRPLAVPPIRRVPEVAAQNTQRQRAGDGGVDPRAGSTDLAEEQQAEAGIEATLQRWAAAMTSNNPRAETAEYAPHLHRYFLRTNVDRAFVEADKEAYLRRGNRTASFALREVHIENETGTTADVRLVKDVTWEQSTSGETHRMIRSQLWMVQTDDGWKIAGERDFR